MKLLANKYLPFIFCIPLFFCLHNYAGLIVDSRLYLLAVVNKYYPERFLNDPAFMFGNQDSYSLFTSFYSIFIKLFGASLGAEVSCIFIHLIWIISALFFIKNLLDRCDLKKFFFPVTIVFVCLTAGGMPFTSVSFFKFVEYETCSRTLSVALGMLGFAFLVKDYRIGSLIVFFVGFIVHPITAGWCLPVWVFFFFPKFKLPVFIISLFLPLTYLIHEGSFDLYPEPWGSAVPSCDVTADMLIRMFVGVCFFGVVTKRSTNDKFTQKFSLALFFTLVIGSYWTAVGCGIKHIFFYQAQPWRVEWLMWAFVMPLYAILLLKSVKNFFRERNAFLHDVCLWLWSGVLFLPNFELGLTLILLLVNLQKNRIVDVVFFKRIVFFITVYTFVLQIWLDTEFSTNLDILCQIFGFRLMCDNVSFLASFEFLIVFTVVLIETKKNGLNKKVVLSLFLLCVFGLSSKYLGLPVLVMALFADFRIKRIWLVGLAACCFVLDVATINYIRPLNSYIIVYPYVRRWGMLFAVGMIPCFLLLMQKYGLLKRKVFVNGSICGVALFLCGFSFANYDVRTQERIDAETGIDDFFKSPIFPQIDSRDKMFFYVSGAMEASSRTQFLSGNYFDYSTHVGEVFFEKQFLEARRRDNLLYHKEDLGKIYLSNVFEKFMNDKMSNPDSLLDRTVFLCSQNEISHLVTDTPNIPLMQLDSTVLYNKQKIYLYSCP